MAGFKVFADLSAIAFGAVTAPMLRFVARNRYSLPRFQKFSDKNGFQIRSDHYYEPTYSEVHLPENTVQERDLPGVDLNESEQLRLLERFVFAEELKNLPMIKPSDSEFGYINKMYGPGDAENYYNIIRHKKPRSIIEIGSGNSTLVALLAITENKKDDSNYDCNVTCIEPYEMPWLEKTGVKVVREKVEALSIDYFRKLGENDILFIDSSHVIRPYGDVLREFQEILPSLNSGVLVHVHDIFTPRDYPERWLRAERRLWNEQYLLESFLAFNNRFKVILANNWLKHNHWNAFSNACPMTDANHEPGAFWMQVQ